MEQQEEVKLLKPRRKKRWIIVAVICLLVIAAVVFYFLKKPAQQETTYSYIRTTTLTKGSLEDSISSTGTVESAKTSNVTTDLSYTVKSVNVAVGDTVSEGDVICTLDTSDLESQIEREEESLAKTKSSAQSSYNSAKDSYDKAKESLSDAKEALAEAKEEKTSAYTPYQTASNAIKTYQSEYDSALSAYESAGAKYVSALKEYNKAVTKYKKGNITAEELASAAKSYMKTVQNYYGGCSIGTYNISDSDSGNNGESGLSTASTVSVTETADSICDGVVSQVQTLSGKSLSYGSGSNTLYKLSKKAQSLRDAKQQCNYESLESAYDTAQNAYDAAEQTYEQCQDSLSQAEEQLEQAEEQLSEASTSDTLEDLQSQLEECELKANQDGTITALNVTVGSSVSSMNAVATISSLDSLKVSITIAEADINTAEIGMSCYITSDASDETLDGTLTQIDPVAGESGSFGAEVTVDTVSESLHIGMNASVEIIVSTTEGVYSVPIDAVGNDDDGSGDYVYRQTGGEGTDMTFEKIYVTTGESNDYYIEISSDELSDGDVIRSTADLTAGVETTDSESDTNLMFQFGNEGGDMPSGDGQGGGKQSGGGGRSDNGGQPGGDSSNFPSGGGNQ